MPAKKAAAAGGAVLAVALAAGLALYGTGMIGGNTAPCAGVAAMTDRLAPLARGEVAALEILKAPRPAPVLTFKGPDGQDTGLSGMKGRTLLVNLWATWCAPCKAEMPALDRLQASFDPKEFQVVAINVDTRNLDRPPLWLKENAIHALAYYADPAGRVLPALQKETGSTGLPTTLLVDSDGCTLGVMKGPAEWSSEDARRLVGAALGRT
ncbi:MAG: TlpA family protein disulfide reductase [Methylobacterium sp.]|uniref:thiol:disulfide interchange protein TlpA n=1 Tax=Methylobacterium sp. TaxID=409 RepID=UPI0025CDB259|nr:TlpA disulfide reductase family protein [Methylobacterium sp.]MBX9934299.1 TlpA family protein disulfide reductase [Methylobacterium sp.]